MWFRSQRTPSASCLRAFFCVSARVSPRPRAPRRLPRATAPRPRRRTSPREGPETPRLSSCYRPSRHSRARARPGTTSPRWSSLFRGRCAAWERSGRGYPRAARSVVRSRGVRGRSSSGHSSRSRRRRAISGSTETGTSDARRVFASTSSGDGGFVHAPESASPTRLGGDGSGAMPPRVASFWSRCGWLRWHFRCVKQLLSKTGHF